VANAWRRTHLAGAVADKAQLAGIDVVRIDERGTSSTCPQCQARCAKPKGRRFKCGSCGYLGYRDIVGARNIAARGGGSTTGDPVVTHRRAGTVPARRDRRRHLMDERRRSCPAPVAPQSGSRSLASVSAKAGSGRSIWITSEDQATLQSLLEGALTSLHPRLEGRSMDETSGASRHWELVDEGWGREAVDFATLSEPGNCREYVAVHHALGVDAGDHLLDVACGSGLAVELAQLRGARCAGIDASARLVAVARDRARDADVRVGDMYALPWPDATFDVVTSFRGVWGTTEDAVGEIRRVLKPGGRLGFTVWGHIKVSPGAWALAPFLLAASPNLENQAAMVSLGRPGAGEALLERYGFSDVARLDVPFAWEFADPSTYARAIASSGPAYEAIQNVGEEAFLDAAISGARPHVRDGLPLRAEIAVVAYLARKPAE
jgi:SAM-dependent methyltransferase/predicted RNA-binding Zn-ribbon protein involved in translation (DUF1610 family)